MTKQIKNMTIFYKNVDLSNNAYWGNLNEVKKLIKAGADINYNEPIIRAVIGANGDMRQTYYDIIKYLIEEGADVNIKENNKNAIAWACHLEKFEIVDLLIKSGKIGKDLADTKEIYTGLLVNELSCNFNYKGRKELEQKFKIIDLVVEALAETVFKLNNLNSQNIKNVDLSIQE